MGLPARLCALALLAASVGAAHGEADARPARRRRPARRVESKPPVPRPIADRAVRCSCTSTSSCPSIGTLAVGEYKPQTLYCNQLRGAENPGSHSANAWYYQCAELANRWLVESVGAPMIRGNADQMCDNASHSSFDVHARGAAYKPVPGDLLVWGGGRMGHVGVVTSVSPSSITFANQNYGHDGLQYPILTTPRTGGFFGSPLGDRQLHAKCIIHPKKLRATTTAAPGPCADVASANDGAYCGASRQSGFAGGDAGTLYTCRGGKATSIRCPGACTLEPVGRADHCS